jgi:hypothetical protein
MVDLASFGAEPGIFWLKYRLFRGGARVVLHHHTTGGDNNGGII